VITVYASASFVLIELINNVSEPLNLPQGLSTIAIVVLAVGFPFAVVLSWIFDVTPKGVEKTKPSREVTEEERASTPGSWRVATYISVVIIVGLISFNVITRSKISENLSLYGKSIAVLPFINNSQLKENDMFINGTMENILNKLCKIKDLRVMSRESVEPYRDTNLPVAEISGKLRVSHILRGSMRKYGDRVVISVQLHDQNNNSVWSGQYDRDINESEELFNLESKIALEVAGKIKAIISPEEEQRIEKVPTTDPMAVQLYQAAGSVLTEWGRNGKREALESANRLYRQALIYDSTYADAITGLGQVYRLKNRNGDRSQESFLDSVKVYLDRSLSYDSENAITYLQQGLYYIDLCDWAASERNLNKSLEFYPNNPVAFNFLGLIYFEIHGDFVRAVQYYEEAEIRNRGELIAARFYRWFGHACFVTGFFDMGEEYLKKALAFDGDSGLYFSAMGNLENAKGNYKKAVEFEAEAYSLGQYFGFIGLWELIFSEQIEVANKWVKLSEEENQPGWWVVEEGYLASIEGDKEKAEQLFNQFMKEFQKGAKLGREWWVANGSGHLRAAMIYAYRGQKDSTYIYLEELMEMKNSLDPYSIRQLEINPMFDTLREEARFQKILRKMQAGYQSAHERMRLHLEETGRL